ncbi:hypothetical protein [Aquibacillus rhizosphaerae]|uniref:Uncharacterized protein n=1 Tax=Aquibacillus rhizosphaerae TaxID=3051431 RepID=A0ABT7L6M8_9BACI|nr:hypothetical protein [Aquibacillus sp. LR5S19]MDL4841523.1 hypothetical protein [Aquibacillus sp. LR5S19]
MTKSCSDTRLDSEKSAEAVVVKISHESEKEQRAEQFYRYRKSNWERKKTTGINAEKWIPTYEKERK